MPERIVLASGNRGKVRGFSELLAGCAISIVPQSDFGVPEVAETGLTFVENALIKARNACAHCLVRGFVSAGNRSSTSRRQSDNSSSSAASGQESAS